jgi:SAM-dependent methyltransferase
MQTGKIDFLRCPTDHSTLKADNNVLTCLVCKTNFPFYSKNLFDFSNSSLPTWFFDIGNHKFKEDYHAIYNKKINVEADLHDLKPWGGDDYSNYSVNFFYLNLYQKISSFLCNHSKGDLVDISSGGGRLTEKFSKYFNNLIFCEAHSDSILHAYMKYQGENSLFLRANYLSLPFASKSVDNLLCIDTLERGELHENQVLKEIKRVLALKGLAVVDFHCRSFHNTPIFFYSKKQIRRFLIEAGFSNFKLKGLGYYPSSLPCVNSFSLYLVSDFLLSLFLKPMRYLILIKNE